MGFQNGDDLPFLRTGHPGMVKQTHQHLVAGHGAQQAAAGDEDIPFPVQAGGETEPAAQLDQPAGERLVRIAGAGQEIGAVLFAQHSAPHQFLHGALDFFIVAQPFFQFFQAAGPFFDLFQNFGLQ